MEICERDSLSVRAESSALSFLAGLQPSFTGARPPFTECPVHSGRLLT